ncbi:hypothetical protein BFN03_19865 [Rhodococcus sp. WMMA185]|uniref:hypothetical protein n=1 Tax=Rhodococcus sp. WMMA185 TaxID=679318 RepID=UPI000878B6DD|nr:hypothetical protein [Rhodococcus sp. WMMA185]AOW94179.1 hypothetical protein BFN03_19865 [Rhodococcus sp. WMMA185]
MKVSVCSRLAAGIAGFAVVGGIAGAGILSSAQPSTSTTAPDVQLAGFASDLGDYLFPGVGQAAVDAATQASETGDPKGAFVQQFPNLVSPTLSVVSYFLPWDPIALYASFYATEQLLNTGQLFPSGLTNPGHEVSDLSAEDVGKLAKNLNTIDSNLRSAGIDINNLDPDKVAKVQSLLDSAGADFNIQSAIDELGFAHDVLSSQPLQTTPAGVAPLAGNYRTTGPTGGTSCDWTRTDTKGNVVERGTTLDSTTVTIEPTDGGFTTTNCAPWNPVSLDTADSAAQKIPGYNFTGEVGVDLQPGSYLTKGSSDGKKSCLWSRQDGSGVTFNSGTTIANPVTVTIEPTDGKFQSLGCADWTPLSQ